MPGKLVITKSTASIPWHTPGRMNACPTLLRRLLIQCGGLGASRLAIALIPLLALAHDPVHAPAKPTAAAADIAAAKKAMDAAKQKLAAQGRYSCCTKPACNLCARTNGSCNCAANLAAGKGACGECAGTWSARGKKITILS